MPDYDAGFKIVAREAGRKLSEVAGIQSDAWEPIGDTVQATERLADRAFRARLGRERFLVYMEAYTRGQSSAPWSILAKSGLLSERERLPALSVVFVPWNCHQLSYLKPQWTARTRSAHQQSSSVPAYCRCSEPGTSGSRGR